MFWGLREESTMQRRDLNTMKKLDDMEDSWTVEKKETRRKVGYQQRKEWKSK